MKNKFLAHILGVLLIGQSAIADTCSDALVTGAHQSSVDAAALCTALGSNYSGNTTVSGTLAVTGASNLTGATTVTGLTTLNGQLSLGALETVAGAGATVADAAALSATKGFHQITGANGTVGWKFVTATPIGSIQFLLNTTAGVPKIYGEAGSTCNGGATDAACTLVTGIVLHACVKTAALTYICS